jgi:hypothetical protein
MRLILVAAMLGTCTLFQPLSACINDSATKTDEQQFVSGYGDSRSRRAAMNRFDPGMLLLLVPSLALVGLGYFWLRQERLAAKRPSRTTGS